jgi:2-dehydro-3-deoxyphosphogluconate aldolase/(4S)-4-hydroxy-2-oxoglutarate aldolase
MGIVGPPGQEGKMTRTTDNAAALGRVLDAGVLVIVRLPSGESLDRVAEAAIRGGAGALEVTMNTPGGLEWLRGAMSRFGDALLLGCGTVLDATQAKSAIAAGARLIVAPDFDPEVMGAARTAGCLAVPGALTPSEIKAAWRAGADLVKIFPATLGGPRYIADVLAPLEGVRLIPTGGIDEANAADFIRAGASAVAIGGSIVNANTVAAGQFDAMAERIRHVVDAVAAARGRTVAAVAD